MRYEPAATVTGQEEPKMTAAEYVERYAKAIGVEPPSEEKVGAILSLAASAAHASERQAAPVCCWLAAEAGKSPAEAVELATGLE